MTTLGIVSTFDWLMKVALIYPPEYNTFWMPYSSLPALTAFLRAGGFETIQEDWNIEIFHRIFTRDEILAIWRKIPKNLDAVSPYPGVPPASELVNRLKGRIQSVADNIESSVALFRDAEKFYNIQEYKKAEACLNDALLVVSLASWDLEAGLSSAGKALEVASDPSRNVYLPFLKEKVEELLKEKPNLVGLSVTLPRQMIPALAVAQLIKASAPEIQITMGGDYPTLIANALENAPDIFKYIDSVVLSEGEMALLGLARAVKDGGHISDTPGILYLDKGVVKRSSLPVMVDADELPTMDFDGLPLDKYLTPEPILPAYSSRGCYWRKCTFCLRPDRRGLSQRDPVLVIKDLSTYLKKYKCHFYHFTDNAIRPRRISAIADAIAESGQEIYWTARTRFSPEITLEWCERVAAGGLVRVIFGVESASKRVLDLMQKGFRIDDVPKVLQGLSKAGIDATLYLMVGFPSETKEEAYKTLNFIERIQDSLTPYALYYVSPFAVPISTPIHKEPAKFEITKITDFPPDYLGNPYSFEFETSIGMSRKEMAEVYVEFRRKTDAMMSGRVLMPHDMLYRARGTQSKKQKIVEEKPVLKMDFIPRLADDLRVDSGYLKKGDKKIRIDENLRLLIEVLDMGKTVKEIIVHIAKSRNLPMANAFIYMQQLLEQGIIALKPAEQNK